MGKAVKHLAKKGQAHLELTITDIVDKATLQAIQDQFFTEKHEVGNGLLDVNAEPIIFERRHCSYCKTIRDTEAGYFFCRKSDKKLIEMIRKSGRPHYHICKGGLLDFGAPVRIENEIVAYFLWGQLRGECGRKKTDRISETLRRLHISARRFGEEEEIEDAKLERKYDHIAKKTRKEIERIKKVGIDFAKTLSVMLSELASWERPQAVAQFVAKISQSYDLDSLFNTCVHEIPRLLGTRDCSILTVLQGKKGTAERLVLRKTSFVLSKPLEDRVSYRIGQGLTGWVWENKCALRLSDIQNSSELSKYRNLKWTQTVNDSDEHREWLGVPLFGWRNDVIGVVRVPQKKRTKKQGGGGFDFKDEVLLMVLAQHIARQIEELRMRERTGTALRLFRDCSVQLSRATDPKTVARVIVRACEKIFGREGKVYYFNVLAEDSKEFRIEDIGGTMAHKHLRDTEFPVDKSLSGLCLRRGRPVIIHNVKKALQKKEYYPAIEGAECAMSAPLGFGEKKFGVLSVCADRQYEFSEEPDLHILRDLASIGGAALVRLEAQKEAEVGFVKFARQTGHILYSRIAALECAIAVTKWRRDAKKTTELDVLENAVEFLKKTADVTTRFGKAWDKHAFRRFELAGNLKHLEKIYKGRSVAWSVRGTLEMVGDPELVEQIVVELVENALRFAPKRKGKVFVHAFRSQIRHGSLHLRPAIVIEVQDNGQGISIDEKESIFLPYQTSDSTRLGLGLSLVKSMVEAHGGSAEERGKPGKGACFRIMFPQ